MSRDDEFESFYDRNIDAVYSYARNRVGESDAEDVTAEVFLAAAYAFRDGRSDLTTAWLIGVARNKIIDQWRRSGTRQRKNHLTASPSIQLPPDWTSEGDAETVMATLESLTQRHRSLLLMKYVHGFTVAQIARQTSETEQAIESALKRARDAFRKSHERRS